MYCDFDLQIKVHVPVFNTFNVITGSRSITVYILYYHYKFVIRNSMRTGAGTRCLIRIIPYCVIWNKSTMQVIYYTLLQLFSKDIVGTQGKLDHFFTRR